jgi:hypothetical protein
VDDKNLAEDDETKPILRQLIIEAAQEVMGEPHPSVKKLRWKQLWDNLDQLDARAHYMLQGARWWQRIRQPLRK